MNNGPNKSFLALRGMEEGKDGGGEGGGGRGNRVGGGDSTDVLMLQARDFLLMGGRGREIEGN